MHIENNTTSDLKEKIVGGYEVDIKFYPEQVSILYCEVVHLCGGSIITPLHILTAAHCFRDFENEDFEDLQVRSGSSHWRWGGALSNVSRIISHENFQFIEDPFFLANDIAIVELREPLNLDTSSQEIPLILRPVKSGEHAIASGWGYVDNDYHISETLKVLSLTVDDEDSCKMFDPLEKKICGRTLSRAGMCYGDSGGPLRIEGQLAGIASSIPVDECGDPNQPSIFTDVFYHKDWIERKIGHVMLHRGHVDDQNVILRR